MHKEELKDEIKALFIDGTENEFLNHFTSRFPRLLVHCYNAVENEARDLLAEYFYLNEEKLAAKPAMNSRKLEAATTPVAAKQGEALVRALSLNVSEIADKAMTPVDPIETSAWELRAVTVAKSFKDTIGLKLEGSELTINCHDVITFPETIINLNTLKIFGISNLFMEKNKLFTKFLQRNGSNVTQLELNESSLTFESVNKIFHSLPKLKTTQYDRFKFNVQNTKPTLILEVLDENGFVNIKLLKKITKECLEVLKKKTL